MISNRFLCMFKSIVQKQLKIHILTWALHQTKKTLCDHQKDIWKKLKERLNQEADKDSTRYFQYFTSKEIEKNCETKMHLTVENEKLDVSCRFHSRILKFEGNKVYHRYVSNETKYSRVHYKFCGRQPLKIYLVHPWILFLK